MAVLLSAESLTKSYTSRPLFEGLSFTVSEGDHVGLVGPNGSGKSTLLKILAGVEEPDSGSRSMRKGVRVGYVPQDPVFAPGKTVEEVLLDALHDDHTVDEHEKFGRVSIAPARQIPGERRCAARCSPAAGASVWPSPTVGARARHPPPRQPTNHLDVEGILWLESMLKSEPEAFVVVSHDRYFLENITKRMLELNRAYPSGLLQTVGTYSDLLEKRDEVLRNEAAYQETLQNLVRREMEWLRRGAKARTTKAKARIQNAERHHRGSGRGRERASDLQRRDRVTASQRKRTPGPPKVCANRGAIANRRSPRRLLSPAPAGHLGPNGYGKTTLLRMITASSSGRGDDRAAHGLRVVYFEQNREASIPPSPPPRARAGRGHGPLPRTAPSTRRLAKRFLFAPSNGHRGREALGGEKARIVLARLSCNRPISW